MKLLTALCSSLISCAFIFSVSGAAVASNNFEDYFPIQQDGKVGFIDKTGKIVIAPQFDSASNEDGIVFSEGLAAVKVSDKWGYIDKSGKFVIPPKFKQESAPTLFYEGLAQVLIKESIIEKSVGSDKSQKYIVREEVLGFIDRSGEFVESLKFIKEKTKFSEGLAKVRAGDKFGYVDKTGKFVSEDRFAEAEDFKEGLAAVKLEASGSFTENEAYKFKYGFIDKTGKFVIKPQFGSAESFSEGLAGVSLGDKSGYIDKTGKIVIAPKFDETYSFSEGLAKVVAGGKSGFIDAKGKLTIGLRFSHSGFGNSINYRGFKEGLAVVEVNNKSGYIDRTGKIIIAPQYNYGSDFNGGVATVFTGGENDTPKMSYIDKTGKVIWTHKIN
jgi:hypothetical protein